MSVPNNKKLSLTDGARITLEHMLLAKEERAQRQRLWLDNYKLPIISLTMVIPGDIKNSSAAQFLFSEATIACKNADFKIVGEEYFISDCGLEALFLLEENAQVIKSKCIEIENTHFLGRFWDIDVISPVDGIISRRAQEERGRKCLICENEAHICTRSQAHELFKLIKVIEGKVNRYKIVKNLLE